MNSDVLDSEILVRFTPTETKIIGKAQFEIITRHMESFGLVIELPRDEISFFGGGHGLHTDINMNVKQLPGLIHSIQPDMEGIPSVPDAGSAHPLQGLGNERRLHQPRAFVVNSTTIGR